MEGIRVVSEPDARAVSDIYAPFCAASSPVSFETVPPSVDEMRDRIRKTLKMLPWLVFEREGQVLGYVYSSPHRARPAYRWSVDVSAYMHADARRQGIATRLYEKLFQILRAQGYHNAYAGIAQPNPASVALHKALGFKEVGVYEHVGYKGGAWHDVSWFALQLSGCVSAPTEPVSFEAFRTTADMGLIMGRAPDQADS
jgi:L-amino acid N-acyltransferase YncA